MAFESISAAHEPRPSMAARPSSLLHWIGGKRALAVFDQAIVSGTSFLVMIAVGRFGGPAELGTYALVASSLALIFAAHESLIARPYAVQLHEAAYQRQATSPALTITLLGSGLIA